jgi:hypothetical protein
MKKLIFLICAIVAMESVVAQEFNEAAVVVQKQLEAYNARNLEAFLATYSDDIIVYNEKNEVQAKGIAQLRESYGNMFKNLPDLYCYIENRIVSENTVIDHEKVCFQKGQPLVEVVAMYTVKDGKIATVHFVKKATPK